jgi:hypothetical protein
MQLEVTQQHLLAVVGTVAAAVSAVLGRWLWRKSQSIDHLTAGWVALAVGTATVGFGGTNWYDNATYTNDFLATKVMAADDPKVAAERTAFAVAELQTRPQPGSRSLVPLAAAVPLTLLGVVVCVCGGAMLYTGYSPPLPPLSLPADSPASVVAAELKRRMSAEVANTKATIMRTTTRAGCYDELDKLNRIIANL